MHTFVVNLESSVERRKNVEKMLGNENLIEADFIGAVDGRKMNSDEREKVFNVDYSRKYYGREIRPGEIGCTLSHQKCYKKIVEDNIPYALILEDDINIVESISDNLSYIEDILNTEVPTVVLISGRFYYTKSKSIPNTHKKIGTVVDAYLAHAYIINKEAAKMAIEEKPWFMADNWKYFMKKGIKIYGVIPHLVDQDRELPSDIMDNLRQFNFKSHYFTRFFRRSWHMLFNLFGHFERASNINYDFLTQYT